MQDFEKLGAFYLGRVFDPDKVHSEDELLLYDAKDLSTHALCVGMTGSGKTGLCISVLEEAGIDSIPAIAIDPKGDLANLFLTFPELRPGDFRPWVDPGEAARNAMTVEQYATHVAKRWRKGLAEWGQEPDRIARLRENCELAVYTPGSASGRPLRVLRALSAPPPELREDPDAFGQGVQGVVSGLLALVGIDADPLRSREHILLTNLVDRAWRAGRDYEIPGLIGDIQKPPFDRLGVMDLESVFPAKDRFGLAMALNNLLASPGFGAWMEGEPLDIDRLLYTPEGRPKISILSIAHLAERERMFFVSMLLNELVTWIRSQPGTSSLRALFYMDEVFGYFPPNANPPSKLPMLTLLKQARAQGLGVMLATQNPVDLDYKGLANMGTWFIGRLQTERDKARLLDGLESASATGLDRQEIDRLLSGLGKRVFVMNNVHEDGPVLFQTRWALSYLRGPLTPAQIRTLARRHPPDGAAKNVPSTTDRVTELERETAGKARPLPRPALPAGIKEHFIALARPLPAGGRLVYRPRLLGQAQLHYANARVGVDTWSSIALTTPLRAPLKADIWSGAQIMPATLDLQDGPEEDNRFAKLPTSALRPKSYTSWGKRLKTALYRDHPLVLLRCKTLKAVSRPGQSRAEFVAELRLKLREHRDLEIEKLRKRYGPRLGRLEERIRTAQGRVEREHSQASQQKLQTAISLGATVLGALFGRKAISTRSIGRATTTLRGAGRVMREHDDIAQAEERLAVLKRQLDEMEAEFEAATTQLGEKLSVENLVLKELMIRPRKTDILIEDVVLLWVPWFVGDDGIAEPGFGAD